MIRLGAAESIIVRLPEEDRHIIQDLAMARGCLLVKDYAGLRDLSVVAARAGLKRPPLLQIYKSLQLDQKRKSPEIFLVANRYARIFSANYVEPRSIKTILDALLRSHVHQVGAIWTHNLRHAASMRLQEQVHITDCLDRSESSVLKLAMSLEGDLKTLHTMSPTRFAAFTWLQNRLAKKVNSQSASSEMTWEQLWEDKKRSSLQYPESKISPITIKLHQFPSIQFLEGKQYA